MTSYNLTPFLQKGLLSVCLERVILICQNFLSRCFYLLYSFYCLVFVYLAKVFVVLVVVVVVVVVVVISVVISR